MRTSRNQKELEITEEPQLEIDFSGKQWPSQETFPLNLPHPDNRKVENELLQDLKQSREFLIITGFTSLSYLIDLYDKLPELAEKKIRIALGFEPNVYQRKHWTTHDFTEEVNKYWLDQNISPLLSGGVINLLNQIEAQTIEFKISEKMHAKLYVGEKHALLGSSNLSKNGLTKQKEANIRVSDTEGEGIQYEAIKQIAENFYDQSSPYHRIVDLLKKLLKSVEWPEALSRAIAELIEGDWIKRYPEAFRYLDSISLWPSQRMGIGQAIHILDNQGSVLVADPTGSGKTKFLACLELALVSRRWQLGKGDQTYSKIICPPIVQDNWMREFENIHFTQSTPISSGILSFSNSSKYERIINELKSTNILIIDEAHNYLNPKSSRSISLKSSLADCSILATATPINKKAEDLLRLVELLDIDNLGDEELVEYKKLRKQNGLVTSEQTKMLRSYIRKFTVRRTKKQLNALIQKDKESYVNRQGKLCCYPVHEPKVYPTGETPEDIRIAGEINDLTLQLKGLINLRKLMLPHDSVEDQQRELEKRLIIAKALARYQVQSKLRSSRAALVEHLVGSDTAFEEFDIPQVKQQQTGDIISTLKILAVTGKPPKSDFKKDILPDYLKNRDKYMEELANEINIYNKVLSLARKMSDARERTKIDLIAKLFKEHDLILAFDSSLISLHYFRTEALKRKLPFTAHVVTGGNQKAKVKIIQLFELGSTEKGQLALCSDAMAEGVNLQQASAVVLLDMPSVLRIAEQRIGRLDRMDSPHKKIKAYWPKDSPAFALKADRRLIKISFMADYLIGSNLELPEELIEGDVNEETIDVNEYIKEFEEFRSSDVSWDGINDSFEAVRNLVYGDSPLVTEKQYEYYKHIDTAVNCKVSILNSKENFGFFSFKGTASRAPKWIFINSKNEVINDLSKICELLMQTLPSAVSTEWNEEAKYLMSSFLGIIEKEEVSLLPNKKRRALKLLIKLTDYYLSKDKSCIGERRRVIKSLRDNLEHNIFKEEVIDYSLWMEQFITIIQPDLNALREKSRYNNPKDISDLFRFYKQEKKLTTDQLKQLLINIPYTIKPSDRVAACIIGVGNPLEQNSNNLNE